MYRNAMNKDFYLHIYENDCKRNMGIYHGMSRSTSKIKKNPQRTTARTMSNLCMLCHICLQKKWQKAGACLISASKRMH